MKISNFKAAGLLRRYAPRNDGPKNRTVQSIFLSEGIMQAFNYSRIL
ncbi:hypothetical protein SDA75_09420 [Legionella pneumophila serogroup 1]